MHYQLIINDEYCYVNEPMEEYIMMESNNTSNWTYTLNITAYAMMIFTFTYLYFKETGQKNRITNFVDKCVEYTNIFPPHPSTFHELLLNEIIKFNKSTLKHINNENEEEHVSQTMTFTKIDKIDKLLDKLLHRAKNMINSEETPTETPYESSEGTSEGTSDELDEEISEKTTNKIDYNIIE